MGFPFGVEDLARMASYTTEQLKEALKPYTTVAERDEFRDFLKAWVLRVAERHQKEQNAGLTHCFFCGMAASATNLTSPGFFAELLKEAARQADGKSKPS